MVRQYSFAFRIEGVRVSGGADQQMAHPQLLPNSPWGVLGLSGEILQVPSGKINYLRPRSPQGDYMGCKWSQICIRILLSLQRYLELTHLC